MARCPSCGFENAANAKFCSECGTALVVAAAPRREERKLVTVVFADLVGSTARAEKLDPEDVRAILRPYHDRVRTELERHGGTVEKFIGDAVVGVFGAPVAHEDDPERAVRAAIAIQEAIGELNEADPRLELEVRIGVNTGEALVTLGARPELGEGMVAGDVMNTAARLQSAAPPAGILVGEQTYRATERAIQYEPAEAVTAKGKSDAVPVWRALARRASWGIDLADARSPLVGRDEEREIVASALARARNRLEPQLVTVVGVPGIGKSRLVRELFRIADEDPQLIVWRQGRSLPYGEGSAFWAFAEIVKAEAGILETDDARTALEKIHASVRDLVGDELEAAWVERRMLPLVGIQAADSSTQGNLEETFAAWRRFAEAMAGRTPVVFVFEDLHWADELLLDFVDSLVDRVTGIPLLVVCTARPELLERRPGWGGGKRNAATISLAPLSDDDTARLFGALLGTPVLPAEEQAALLQRAGGNPLFAEEYARMLADGSGSSAAAPETLQGVVAARIDALPAEEKKLLQLAAVLGKVFWTDALSSLAGLDSWTLDERMHALERKEFVRREHRSAVAGAKQYAFVHALVRDGAYGQLSRAARADVHRRVADWLETLPAERADDRSETLAHHLLAAIDYVHAAGLDEADLVPRAARALREAGDRAWRTPALEAAIAFYSRLRELDPSVDDDPYFLLALGLALGWGRGFRDEGAVELQRAADALADHDPAAAAQATVTRGEYDWQRGDHDLAFVYFERARDLVVDAPVSERTLHVVVQVSRFLALAGRYDEAAALVDRAIEMADELGDEEQLAEALNNRGMVRASLGHPGWLEDTERSLELTLRRNSFRAGRAYVNLGSSLADTAGDLVRAEQVMREGLAFGERMGFTSTATRWFTGNLAEMLFLRGGWDEALVLAAEDIRLDAHYMQQVMFAIRAQIRLARGDFPGAAADGEQMLTGARSIRDPQALDPALVTAALIAKEQGDTSRANALLDEIGTPERAAGMWIAEAALLYRELARQPSWLVGDAVAPTTPWRQAGLATAAGDLGRAAEILAGRDARTYEAAARLRFGEELAEAGEIARAEVELSKALQFYREVQASAYVRRAEALLPIAG